MIIGERGNIKPVKSTSYITAYHELPNYSTGILQSFRVWAFDWLVGVKIKSKRDNHGDGVRAVHWCLAFHSCVCY